MSNYHSIHDILVQSKEHDIPFWKVILQDDAQVRQIEESEVFEVMRSMYHAMKQADQDYEPSLKSPSGLAGGDGEKLHQFNQTGRNIAGPFLSLVMEKAVKMAESNACMKRIVAAPTAGACGVIPAVFLSYEEEFHIFEDRMVEALFVSAGVGNVIAENASIAGAFGGCQAEIGSAAAMASAGLVYLQGGTNEQIADAIAFSLKNMLGLTCDPVCGLVEVPCIKRNSGGAVNAATSAQMALAGVKSAIDADQVIDAMRRVGEAMPSSLKETSEGGLALTAEAEQLKKKLESESL